MTRKMNQVPELDYRDAESPSVNAPFCGGPLVRSTLDHVRLAQSLYGNDAAIARLADLSNTRHEDPHPTDRAERMTPDSGFWESGGGPSPFLANSVPPTTGNSGGGPNPSQEIEVGQEKKNSDVGENAQKEAQKTADQNKVPESKEVDQGQKQQDVPDESGQKPKPKPEKKDTYTKDQTKKLEKPQQSGPKSKEYYTEQIKKGTPSTKPSAPPGSKPAGKAPTKSGPNTSKKLMKKGSGKLVKKAGGMVLKGLLKRFPLTAAAGFLYDWWSGGITNAVKELLWPFVSDDPRKVGGCSGPKLTPEEIEGSPDEGAAEEEATEEKAAEEKATEKEATEKEAASEGGTGEGGADEGSVDKGGSV